MAFWTRVIQSGIKLAQASSMCHGCDVSLHMSALEQGGSLPLRHFLKGFTAAAYLPMVLPATRTARPSLLGDLGDASKCPSQQPWRPGSE